MTEALRPDDVFSWLDSLGARGITPGLERIAALCAALGRPERTFPSVLVAGTNGKGSTAATLDAILGAAGYRTGFYSSPHLVRLNERLRIGGEDVPIERLAWALDAVRRIVETAGDSPAARATWFEVMTAAAFRLLSEERVDLAILEVGLGGRCDATNLAPAILSVVTPIGLDHTEMLGSTLAAIAREKAGIVKTTRPAVSAPQPPEAAEVLRRVAESVRAPLEFLEAGSICAVATAAAGTKLAFEGPLGRLELESPLAGAHQATNVALAVIAAGKLAGLGFERIDRDAVLRGVAATRWPGRLERRLVGGQAFFVDGCHNPHGAESVAAFLDEVGLSRRVVIILGVLADKDAAGVVAPLARRARAIVTVRPPSPRGREAAELAEIVRRERPDIPIGVADDFEQAVRLARGFATEGEPILVAGSLVLAGEALAFLDRSGDEAAAPPSR